MRNDDNISIALGCAFLIPVIVLAQILRAWAITKLWAWFITPTWHMDPPTYGVALGIAVLVGMLTKEDGDSPRDPNKTARQAMVSIYCRLLLNAPLAVGMGWIVRHWA